MIATLTPEPRFAPVPHIRISIADADTWDGGGASTTGPDHLDGGGATTNTPGFDAGHANSLTVTLPAGTDQITLWWLSEGRSGMVAGAVKRAMSASFAHLDVEAGFDVLTQYEVECFQGGISSGRVALGSATLPWEGDPDNCLIQQPMNPYLFAVVTTLDGSWPSITREADGELVRPQGAVYPSLVATGPRQSTRDVGVTFGAPTREIATRVWETLGTEAQPQLPVWLIRAHQGILPRRFYAHVKSLKEEDLDIRDDVEWWSQFSATVDEVARPAPGLQIAPLSYDDLDVSYPDYDTRDAAYSSYDAMDTDFSLAGAAN